MEYIFWFLAFAALYSYLIYPGLLVLLLRLQGRRVVRPVGDRAVSMTLIVTAYNEEMRIREKIDDCLAIRYPDLELIVASDCSSDGTDHIVREYADRGVRLVRATSRLGKENAQLAAILEARGEVLVLSDVATRIPPDALQRLAVYFRDDSIGAVSSEDRFVSQGGGLVGEGAYVRYEMALRRMESALSGLVGLSGSFFATRARICADWDISSPSDFNTALNCARHGLRAVTAPDVLGYYSDLKDPSREYERKVRTVVRGMTAIVRHTDVLNPTRFGLFAWQVWSHKVLRWAVPWILLLVLVVNLALVRQSSLYGLLLTGQIAFYGVAIAAHVSDRVRSVSAIRILYFFVQVNVAIMDASWRLIAGRRMQTWQPSAR